MVNKQKLDMTNISQEQAQVEQVGKVKRFHLISWLALSIVIVISILILLGYVFSWKSIGVIEYTYNANGSLSGIKSVKTLWDWLDLLVAPFLIAYGVWWLKEAREEIFLTEQKAKEKLDKQLSQENQWQTNLESYFDRMTELILKWKLFETPKDSSERTIARAYTLATLRSINGKRKGTIIRFLIDGNIIRNSDPVFSLSGADLRETRLEKANLSRTNLIRTNFSNACFYRAKFHKTLFNNSNLTNADLTNCDLREAILDRANLESACLVGANLSNASLIRVSFKGAELNKSIFDSAKVNGAKFSEADIRGAKFQNLDISGADFQGAIYDQSTIWPDGFDFKNSGAVFEI